MADGAWEYGFYDSHPAGNWWEEPEPQENPTIYWYVFGFLTHDSADSAEHTGRKACYGQPVIVRRRSGSEQWEHVPASPKEGNDRG